MPRFEPFAGLRYDLERVELADVTAPPYDVIGPDEQARLEARSPYNIVRVDLPGGDYDDAGRRFAEWQHQGVIAPDDAPSFYVYRMGYHDEAGRARQTAGVIGALELSVPGEGDVLPHERTMPKPKSDRLDLQRATRANLSPVWGLSLATGLSALCELPGPPDARCTDEDGIHHRLWRITQPGVVDAISRAVASAPIVIADGHHRYETALAYRDEAGTPEADLLMAYVVELADEQLTVRPIHRLISGLPDGVDLLDTLAAHFDVFDAGPATSDTLAPRMADAGALALVTASGAFLLKPKPETFPADIEDLDSARLDVALAELPAPPELAYQHGVDHAVAAVEKGDATAAVLLRPATVGQIAAAAHARRRMPEKSTFFWPKPRTGLVFRSLG
ncbi:MAG: hypothetical protein JWO37_1603 [Acidimicrobiales bacterium]|jgi:uncharacterized protein (DUF1015 family)|nr:hypothetical protein [Acidimicrobiales bacterium]